ncbi:MAG: ATP-binding cassette domain-containing protein [Planctomycetia bacterium]|nr:ATP-binding cassette domain-containing protein [Planctomycetia bacterium]
MAATTPPPTRQGRHRRITSVGRVPFDRADCFLQSCCNGKCCFVTCCRRSTGHRAGSVKIAGIDIVKLAEPMRDRLRADRVGLVFQQFNLLPGFTALENVLVAMGFGSRPADRSRAEALLTAVGLADRLHHKPAALSIGQQQRVAVARALANRPRVLLADEPTASIDPAHQQQVIDLLQTSCRDEQVSLVVVTHAPEVAKQFPVRYRLEDFNRAAATHAPATTQSASTGGQR